MRIKNLTINLASKSLTDRFTLLTPDIVSIDQIITGKIKDFSYTFKVSEISRSNDMTTVAGVYDVDDMLNKPLAMSSNGYSAAQLMNLIANQLGKTAVVNIDDFYPKPQDDSSRPTAKEVISNCFNWTDKIPHRLINVFERQGVINVIQRGKETNSFKITNYNNLTITQKRITTLQDSTDTAGVAVAGTLIGTRLDGSDGLSNAPLISGTFSYGDASVTYSNGLVTQERHGDEVTNYEYSLGTPPSQLIQKDTINTNGRTLTNYEYANGYLVKETEKQYSGDSVVSTRITRHIPLGQGIWATVVEEDGVTVSTSIGQGSAASSSPSAQAINEYSRDKTGGITTYGPPIVPVVARPKFNTNEFPVCDTLTLQTIASALEWLNGKIEERVVLDVYDEQILDFSKRIQWQGNEYYLESNSIKLDPNSFVQSVEFVRWF